MLSSVLNSERAVLVNVEIVRAFVRLRRLLASHQELSRKLESLEAKYAKHDEQLVLVFEAIRQLMSPPAGEPKKGRSGFQAPQP